MLAGLEAVDAVIHGRDADASSCIGGYGERDDTGGDGGASSGGGAAGIVGVVDVVDRGALAELQWLVNL